MAITTYRPSVTPSYPDITYSKGPRSNYFTGPGSDTWLKISLNQPQTDIDDEWGQTDLIAFRSVIDHVTSIWETLWGPDGSQGTPATDSVIGVVNSLSTLLNVNTQTLTIGSTILNSTGLAVGNAFLHADQLHLDDGIDLIAGIGANKYIRFFDTANFQFKASLVAGDYSLVITMPFFESSGSFSLATFTSLGINFDTGTPIVGGPATFFSIASNSTITAATTITAGSTSTSTLDYQSLQLVKDNNNKIVLSLSSGLIFTCGSNTAIEMLPATTANGSVGWLKFFTNAGIETMWIETSPSANLVGMRGGASLNFLNSSGSPYTSVATNAIASIQVGTSGYFSVYQASATTFVATTSNTVSSYISGALNSGLSFGTSSASLITGSSPSVTAFKVDGAATRASLAYTSEFSISFAAIGSPITNPGVFGLLTIRNAINSDYVALGSYGATDSALGIYCGSVNYQTTLEQGKLSFWYGGSPAIYFAMWGSASGNAGGLGLVGESELNFYTGFSVLQSHYLRVQGRTTTSSWINIVPDVDTHTDEIDFYHDNVAKSSIIGLDTGALIFCSSTYKYKFLSLPTTSGAATTGYLWADMGGTVGVTGAVYVAY